MSRAALIAVLVVACSRERAAPPPPPAGPTPAAGPVAVTILVFAAFKNDNLSECDEVFVKSPKPLSADAGAAVTAMADAFWESLAKKKGDTTITRLSRSCEEQFRDRKPFGVCFDTTINKDAAQIRGNIRHFSFGAGFKSDWAMRECLESGGRWESMSRDSPEFLQAKLSHDMDNAQKNYDDARKDVDRAVRSLR